METWKFIESLPNEQWRPIYDLSNENDVALHVLIPLIIMLITYWSTSLFFSFVDMKGKPNFITKFKIPDKNGTNYPRTSPQRLRHVAFQVLFNQTVIAVPVIYFCYMLKSITGCNKGYVFPKLHRFVFDFILQILTEEVFFYYSHRILHHPLLYKRFHKRHHEWVSPIGVSAIYCTPVEHVLSNLLPTFLGSVIFKLHVTSMWSWLVFATSYGVIVHSGYHLPFTPTPEFHHYHHHKFTENFGVAGMLDWLHGTDKEFRKSKAFERNVVLLSLSPIS
ncbi:fatty acid hydroxylase domain-containing protein 2-like [Parasteatoda tepidariorum]|uniref:fatty acid hydroxylase domain-containing protein 2-like n=1 Tax=Parasteatoda tepidariorum TaxID=114398 RepID=UPI00077FD900|nr:fatty acid hydroxylase domain-containing protein 2-like [Parasteatoda tepidariorum]XP_015909259.1 fatty acid hydroxylase domain-containing protein 2-like [Parasteatoda tepidariorum]XP_015909260.1 fatty acid hydroxylase domain-containing protein 2-like [Parasteatoda tepidariorum]